MNNGNASGTAKWMGTALPSPRSPQQPPASVPPRIAAPWPPMRRDRQSHGLVSPLSPTSPRIPNAWPVTRDPAGCARMLPALLVNPHGTNGYCQATRVITVHQQVEHPQDIQETPVQRRRRELREARGMSADEWAAFTLFRRMHHTEAAMAVARYRGDGGTAHHCTAELERRWRALDDRARAVYGKWDNVLE